MFFDAVATAARFTRPVVLSRRMVNGRCTSSVGAFVVVNEEGWIVTAAHLIKLIQESEHAVRVFRKYQEDVRAYERAIATTAKPKKQDLRHLKRPAANAVRNCSAWWATDNVRLVDCTTVPSNDLALARLEPFTPHPDACYPEFKAPGPELRPGRSLCRIGYSFHDIVPAFDEERQAFILPEGAVPPPLFANEGMLARLVRSPAPGGNATEPGLFIETTSPGLQGQSGGPIFDTDGRIWGIQSHTKHYPLGFSPTVPGKPLGQAEHQFLNVGVGIHAKVVLELLEQQGVGHQRSA